MRYGDELYGMQQKDVDKTVLSNAKRYRTMDALRSTVEKVDRILTGYYDMEVVLADDDEAHNTTSPGWTDGEQVYINAVQLKKDIEDKNLSLIDLILAYKGVNYHELGHLLFTPRLNESLPRMVKSKMNKPDPTTGIYGDQALWTAWNMLEDQRMELLFVGSYAPTVIYFKAIALKWLVGDTANLANAFPLTWGRKFLPLDLRLSVRDAWVAKYSSRYGSTNVVTIANRMAAIIDEFLMTVYPADTQRGMMLVEEFLKLLRIGQPNLISIPTGAMGSNHGSSRKGQGEPVISEGQTQQQDQKDARDWAREWIEEEEQEMEERETPTADSDTVTGAESDDTEDDGDGQDHGAKGEGHDAPKQSDPDASTPGAGGAGDNDKDEDGVPMNDLSEILQGLAEQAQEALEDALQDSDLQQDMKDMSKSIQSAAASGGASGGDYAEHELRPVKPENMVASKKIQKLLSELRHDLEPTWLKGEPIGKLSIRRKMMRDANPGMFDIFDRWDEGAEEELSTEVVILLDQSGSMTGAIDQASEAMWILKHAFDKHDVRTTVLGFSDDWCVLLKGDEKASRVQTPHFDTHGGTDPTGALEHTLNIMFRSSANNKIVFAITDGGWWVQAKASGVINNLKKMGVVTVLVGLDCRPKLNDGGETHNMDVCKDVSAVDDITALVKDTVANISRRLMQEHG